MEENSELKAYVFAQYIGQKVEYNFNQKVKGEPYYGLLDKELLFEFSTGFSSKPMDKCRLQLKPLSVITDEQTKEFIAIALSDPQNEYDDAGDISISEVHIESISKSDVEIKFDVSVRCWEGIVIYSTMRGIFYTVSDDNIAPIFTGSILVEWMRQYGFASFIYYNGTHYSVEKLIELGIITIKN